MFTQVCPGGRVGFMSEFDSRISYTHMHTHKVVSGASELCCSSSRLGALMCGQNNTMRELGCPLTPAVTNELMTEKEGVAMKLVYKMKMAIDRMEKTGALARDGM